MPMIDSQPLSEQLTRIQAANTRCDALVEASRGKHVTDSHADHTERMRGIDEAQAAYHLELVKLSALVQSAIERAERIR